MRSPQADLRMPSAQQQQRGSDLSARKRSSGSRGRLSDEERASALTQQKRQTRSRDSKGFKAL